MPEEKIPERRLEYGTFIVHHNGYDLRYSDNEDAWSCLNLELTNKSLSRLKTLVNQKDAESRRLSDKGIGVLMINHHDWEKPVPMMAVLIADDKAVWCLRDQNRADKRHHEKERMKIEYDNLALDNDEARAAILRWEEAKAATSKAQAAQKAARDAIPRLTRSMLVSANLDAIGDAD